MAFANRKKPSDEPGNNNQHNKQTTSTQCCYTRWQCDRYQTLHGLPMACLLASQSVDSSPSSRNAHSVNSSQRACCALRARWRAHSVRKSVLLELGLGVVPRLATLAPSERTDEGAGEGTADV